MNVSELLFLYFAILAIVSIFHELGHIFVLIVFGYRTRLKLLNKFGFPIALAVIVDEMEGIPFTKLAPQQKRHYTLSAFFPYLFIFPFSFYLIVTPFPATNFFPISMSAFGLMIAVWHFINLPLEFMINPARSKNVTDS